MAVALRQSTKIGSLISVDNAPSDVVLNGSFGRYMQGMRKVIDAQVTKAAEADVILQEFEEVTIRSIILFTI